jgi:hypothetical protein
MLDGRGRARIADFGLAVRAEEAAGRGEVAGTLAYMALFTGRRPGRPPEPPPALVRDLDPAIERVILQCLEPDPRARPSVLHVAAALPGGDLLAAARAAGESSGPPSPGSSTSLWSPTYGDSGRRRSSRGRASWRAAGATRWWAGTCSSAARWAPSTRACRGSPRPCRCCGGAPPWRLPCAAGCPRSAPPRPPPCSPPPPTLRSSTASPSSSCSCWRGSSCAGTAWRRRR